MNAAYRLMGNFPSRGFGDSLSSADFNSGAAIVSGKDARLPMSGVPRSRAPQMPNEVTEAYHAYEIHPLSYGRLAVMYSATGAMMQANGTATRPCSYTNAVTWSGDGVPESVSSDAAMCSMLRYNDFITLQELWVLPKDVSTLPSKPWVEDPAIKLDYMPTVPVSDAMYRSLLANYWRAASLQFFGPWDSGKHMFCLYRDDLLMQHIANRDRNFTVSISNADDCRVLVPQAKGFLWQMVLTKLPRQIRNITSCAAAVPLQHAHSLYRDAAMCVVYPGAEADFDFMRGRFPALEKDEDSFMQQVLGGYMGSLLGKMHARYAAITGKTQVDECPFMADYDLALALYRIENAQDDWQLLANWYAAAQHLALRHDIRGEMAARIMQDADDYVDARIKGRADAIAHLLTSQTERAAAIMAQRLQSFLWEKQQYQVSAAAQTAGEIVIECQENGGSAFFAELPAARVVPEHPGAVMRMAALMSAVLGHFVHKSLTPQQLQQLAEVAPAHAQSKEISAVMAQYLVQYQLNHPDERIRLLQLAVHYLDADEQAAQALNMLSGRLDQPITKEESVAFGSIWPRLKQPEQVLKSLNDYIAALYVRYFDDLSVVSRRVELLNADITDALVTVFTTEPGCTLHLQQDSLVHVLGHGEKTDALLAYARAPQQVEPAYRAYLSHQLKLSVQYSEPLYQWIVTMINHSLATPLYAQQKAREEFIAWCTPVVHQYTLQFAAATKQLPTEDAFRRMCKLATDKSPVFAANQSLLQEAYETLLQAEVEGAKEQVQQLAPWLSGMKPGSLVQQIVVGCVGVQLSKELQKGRFWDVMNRKDVVSHIQRTGTLPRQLFDDQTRKAAKDCIKRELATITDPAQYRRVFNEYATAENQFKRSISIPDFATDATISVMWHEVAAQTFMGQFEGFFQKCESIDKARSLLLDVAENTVGVRQKAAETLTGRIIHLLMDVQEMLTHMPDETQLLSRVVDKATSLRMTQSGKALELCRKDCEAFLQQEKNFIRRVGIALLCSVVFNDYRYDWRAFLLKLVPNMDEMMRNPYASQNLSLLASVSGVLRLLENSPTQDHLLERFVQFLKTDSTMMAYTNAVCKDRKQMALYFPERSGSLRAWLG